MEVAVTDGLLGLAVMGTMTALAPRDARLAVLAGMAGAALPDLDKPSKVFFGRSPFPRAVDRIHMRIQDEAPHRLKYELTAAAVFFAAAVGLLRGSGKSLTLQARAGGHVARQVSHEGSEVLIEALDRLLQADLPEGGRCTGLPEAALLSWR